MIGKGKLFDIISRTADDVNNPNIQIEDMIGNFKTREGKFNKQLGIQMGIQNENYGER